MPGTRNLTNFLGIVISWILEENLLLLLCHANIISNYILNLFLIHTGYKGRRKVMSLYINRECIKI